MPAVVGRSKREVFLNLKDRVWNRLQSWKNKNLSQAGKAVLLKSVIQTMPAFVMSCFMVPSSICSEIEGMMSDFFWHNKGIRKIHWISWENLCVRKEEGGLGFQKMGAFNLAMLAKQLWRIISQPHCLLSRVLKQKYFPTTDVLSGSASQGCSFTWRSIVEARPVILLGSRWQVGDGLTARIWLDRWIPRPISFRVITAPHRLSPDAKVATLFYEDRDLWNETLVRNIFRPEDADVILGISVSRSHPDTFHWHYDTKGRFSVRSAYHLLVDGSRGLQGSSSSGPVSWKFLWRAAVPPKVQLFAWKICREALPSASRLARRGILLDSRCVWCGEEAGDLLHVFLHCHYSRLVWALTGIPSRHVACGHACPELWIRGLHQKLDRDEFCRAS
ncbi:UNVERIFIED_CONTAM: putative mitochondrial protein [Sesamum radiatum]|uniref:Mitochondrial protein n=1 Tax=Sesamum radiatum TaxID=300843 RepID=A0AAW2RFR6_SESRA